MRERISAYCEIQFATDLNLNRLMYPKEASVVLITSFQQTKYLFDEILSRVWRWIIMKTLITVLCILTLPINYANSTDTYNVPQGTIPVIDGTISSGEWDDAYEITYQAGVSGTAITISCYIKHNGTDTFYIAQSMPNTLCGDRNLVWLDTFNNGGTLPQTDDYMLNKYHMNGSPTIEERGTGSSWNAVTQNGWIVALTGEDWSSNPGQIEFAVNFSKLGITAGIQKTIGFGIAFGELVIPYNPSKIWSWPAGSDYLNPDSWADLSFFGSQGNINEHVNEQGIVIIDNPVTSTAVVTLTGNGPAELNVFDLTSRLVATLYRGDLNGSHSISWNTGDLVPGMYILRMNQGSEVSTEKIMVLR